MTSPFFSVKKNQLVIIDNVKGGEVTFLSNTGTHTLWSILPWDVPWDAGHFFFLGLTYVILGLLGGTLTLVAFRTWRNLKKKST
ncbi:MAG: hypothetical protein AB1585_16855 [Thermodesulfobacteriota bacterium]